MTAGTIDLAIRRFINKHENYQQSGHSRPGICLPVVEAKEEAARALRIVLTNASVRAKANMGNNNTEATKAASYAGDNSIVIRWIKHSSSSVQLQNLTAPQVGFHVRMISRKWSRTIDASVNQPRKISDQARRSAARVARSELANLAISVYQDMLSAAVASRSS